MDRRTVLAATAGGLAVLAGCPYRSATPAGQANADPCEGIGLEPDLVVSNRRAEAVTVAVEIARSDVTDGEPGFEASYKVEADSRRRVHRVFREVLDRDADGAVEVSVEGEDVEPTSREVAIRMPHVQTIDVRIGEADVEISRSHVDLPSEARAQQEECYWEGP